jgi:hypothetical protein
MIYIKDINKLASTTLKNIDCDNNLLIKLSLVLIEYIEAVLIWKFIYKFTIISVLIINNHSKSGWQTGLKS